MKETLRPACQEILITRLSKPLHFFNIFGFTEPPLEIPIPSVCVCVCGGGGRGEGGEIRDIFWNRTLQQICIIICNVLFQALV